MEPIPNSSNTDRRPRKPGYALKHALFPFGFPFN